MHNKTLLFVLALMALVSCSSKKNTKEALLEDIKHYNIDTIVAQPLTKPVEEMTDAEKCRMKADEVLRKYPELYSAANKLTEKYNLWLEREENFISLVFVDNDKQRSKIFADNKQRLSKRLEQMNIIEPLCAAIYDENDAVVLQPLKLQNVPDAKQYNDLYHSIMMAVADAYAGGKRTGKPDERMTACNLASKSWDDYVASFPVLLSAVPEQCRGRVETGLRRIQQLHLLDMRNLYLTFWSTDKPGYLVTDDISDDASLKEENKEILQYIK